MKTYFFTILVTLFSTTYVWAQNLETELSPADLKAITAHEFVLKTRELPGSVWPEITYYAIVGVSPLEAAGVFAAYDAQKDYVPNVIKSTPVKHLTATEVLTDYELHMPFPISNAHYIHGAKLFKHKNDYEVQWYMLESSSAEDVKGSVYFQFYEGKTLMRYRSYVKPKSVLGSLVKSRMLKDVLLSITAIRNFMEKSKRENPVFVSKYSEFIIRALNGEFVYQTIIDKK
ncbi:hypothetical protein SHI21_16675 [Bacteriovorax sp. PP10]|uniref:Coenzyme Q-binding protein COQ10 START domain-containing protein n=1 Tax=Bacteriovorax antarcticus TaxID=3088717 RepID=A0ABU5VY38_9BACT|nr:hypothetical protein [Bacteriovorax sp. PP10]MEA9357867.1 hypothetical protein [Bacteriovorax sp. PP10]